MNKKAIALVAGVLMVGSAAAQPRDTEMKFAQPSPPDVEEKTALVEIEYVEILEPTADDYESFRGRVYTPGDSFFWGGSFCPNMTVSDSTVSYMLGAMHAGGKVVIYHRAGAVTNKQLNLRARCVVGMKFH